MSDPSWTPEDRSLTACLVAVAEALTAPRDQREIFDVVLTAGLGVVEARWGAGVTLNGDQLKVASVHGQALSPQELPDLGSAVRRALQLGEALIEPDESAGLLAVLPLMLNGSPLGALVFAVAAPHQLTPDTRQGLRGLAAQCAGALGRAQLTVDLERRMAEGQRRLEQANTTATVLAALGDALQRASTPDDVAHLALAQLGPALHAQVMLVVRLDGDRIKLPVIWGDQTAPISAYMTQPGLTLRDTPLLWRSLRQGTAVYLDDYRSELDAVRSLPPLACAIEPIRSPGQEVEGFLVMWRDRMPVGWPEQDRQLLARAAGTIGLALERASTAARMEEDARAYGAFVAFTEATGTQTDILALARQATEVLCSRFPDATAGYSECEQGLWKLKVWSGEVDEALLPLLQAGVPEDTPLFAEMLRRGEAVFQDGWEPDREALPHSGAYGAAANVPLLVNGEVRGVLGAGLRNTRQWSEPDRALMQAVGRGLTLALERAEQTHRLELQNAALDARTRALEGFADLSRDLVLEQDAVALVGRAQEILVELLPSSISTYYEPEQGRWRLRSYRGQFRNPRLLDAFQRGLPRGATVNVDRPYDTGAPYYQDHYDPATTSVVRDEVSVIRSSASFPVRQGAVTRGVLVVGLHELRPWSSIERVLLETIVRSLGLALERAESVSHLAEERGKLRAANEELEAFAYSVSHDLRAPVRHMIGFIQLLRRHLGDLPDARAARYLTVVEEAAGRMNVLIDALLELSRTSRADLRLERVDLNALVAGVQADLEPDLQHRRVTWDVALMPAVTGDVELLRQVMTNLLDNALKYTRTQNPAVIRVWAEDRDHEWAVLVSDNGAGFDPRNAPKLFGVFQRLHRQEDYEGVGVGLANVRRIITRHQGSVFAQGAVDHGATFGFTLPKTVVNSGALSSA